MDPATESAQDERQARTLTDDEATNARLEQWWTREMELLQEMVDSGHLSGPSVGMAARGLWNMAYKAGAERSRKEALGEAADAIANIAPYNCELNPDGTEDPITGAWVGGIHDSWSVVRALAGEAPKEEN